MTEPLMQLTKVNVTLTNHAILHDVSCTIERGQITTIIGPNGAGKSTLVKVIVGLETATTGRIDYPQGKLRVGYMPQSLFVDQSMPIKVGRFLSLVGKQKPTHAEREHALTLVDMLHVLDKPLHALSGGEFQRVLLARAILQKPDLMVLDEPMQGVDINGQAKLYKLIAKLRDSLNCAVVMVSHDLHLVMAQTDNVLCLNGHICCHGQPKNVSRHPEYLKLFGAQVSENLAVYAHNHDHHHTPQGDVVNCSDECDHHHD